MELGIGLTVIRICVIRYSETMICVICGATGCQKVPRIGAYRGTDAPQYVNGSQARAKESLTSFMAVAALKEIASLTRSQARGIVRNDSP